MNHENEVHDFVLNIHTMKYLLSDTYTLLISSQFSLFETKKWRNKELVPLNVQYFPIWKFIEQLCPHT